MTNPNVWGQSFHSGSNAKWIQNLHNAHRPTVILGSIGVFSGICFLDFAYNFVTGHKHAPASHNPAWAEATRSYLRAQNCNPITGVSSKK
ncbi:hypothetical protein TrLO_g15823 [Triparma laevis f. longispina]|uniref:Uncharacterized protein n=1 Tax=Triparma laevis f. longispina TaxID=1714387 RepID=A0A9W7AW64_9STRA|nr:hypothetical protein TrLO_g15823 [Triparma laevis f. longispina]